MQCKQHFKNCTFFPIIFAVLCFFVSCTNQKPQKQISKPKTHESQAEILEIRGRNGLIIQVTKKKSEITIIRLNDSTYQIQNTNNDSIINVLVSKIKKLKQTEPKNAFYKYTNNQFEVVKEEKGTFIDTSIFRKTLLSLLKGTPKSFDLENFNCYVNPTIKYDDQKLIQLLPQLKRILELTIEYKFENESVIVKKETLGKLITTGDNGNIKIDEGSCFGFINSLAKAHDVISNSISFKTHANVAKTAMKSELGKRMNVNAEVKRLVNTLMQVKSATFSPIMIMNGVPSEYLTVNRNYIEVDLSSQKLYCFKSDTIFLSSDIVSGNVNAGMGSPKGAFFIKYKETNTRLDGPGYSTHVNYWMPFFEGVGLHDALWRNKFGGSIYMGGGSHGCINLPYNIAKTIFENYPQGSIVISY